VHDAMPAVAVVMVVIVMVTSGGSVSVPARARVGWRP
jgi:hypothetical protein